ncbi:MAG: hypothetical protein B0D88_01620 [Candidatus Sedimenticola endophacoides]|nr:MAG: hypothetical protein B0D84_01570 [Candidatus Sedimenticola endophacoides]OQX44842.1 MAG: hypothetical protein B0D88_01620 [Candidatus Sedimenticola endophacoides]
MTGIGWLLVLFVVGFFVMLLLRIGPIYLENYSIKGVLESLETEPLITRKSKVEIKGMIMKRMRINGVYDFDPKSLDIVKSPGLVTVSIDYSVQKSMFANIDVIVHFSEKVELVSN